MLEIFLLFSLLQIYSCDACPNGMIASFSNPNNCYLFVQNRSEFITAEGFCQQQGGHLTSIANAFDNMFLSQEAFSAFHDNEADNYWIGGTNELIPGKWSWIDGTPFNYADWMKGQPENISAANAIAVSTTTALWIAENGYDKKPFVCLIPGLTDTTTTTTTTTKHPISCEKDWKYYENTGFCYKAFSNFNITWEDAEKYCYDNFNSHLVSIHDLKESVFVADLVRSLSTKIYYPPCFRHQCWIGLYTVSNNTIWNWTDDSSFDYLGWSPGEPNWPGDENCGSLMLTNCNGDDTNYWNNVECSYNTENFVCKKPRS